MAHESLLIALKQNKISQREVVSILIEKGYYDENERESLKVRLNMALHGKRVSEGYQLLLKQVKTVVFDD